MPKRRCSAARCRILVDYTEQYCEKHKKSTANSDSYAYRKQYDAESINFYNSRRWRTASKLYRLNKPYCERCLTAGIIVQADVVDHIKERKDLTADEQHLLYDASNLMSLCHACHNAKSARERNKRKNTQAF